MNDSSSPREQVAMTLNVESYERPLHRTNAFSWATDNLLPLHVHERSNSIRVPCQQLQTRTGKQGEKSREEVVFSYRSPKVVLDLVTNSFGAHAIHRTHVPEEHAPEHRVPQHLYHMHMTRTKKNDGSARRVQVLATLAVLLPPIVSCPQNKQINSKPKLKHIAVLKRWTTDFRQLGDTRVCMAKHLWILVFQSIRTPPFKSYAKKSLRPCDLMKFVGIE